MGWLRRVGREVVVVDWAPISLVAATRAAILTAALLGWAVADDRVDALVPAALGLLFACVADPPASEWGRIRALAWFAVWGTVATLLGGLVADHLALHLVVAVVVATVAGYAGATGRVGQTNGMLALVLFAIAAGTPVSMDDSVRDALVLGVGALVALVVIALPGIRGAARGPRAAYARFARGLGHARADDPLAVGAAVHATRERELVESITDEPLAPALATWLEALAADARTVRLGLLALASAVIAAPGPERSRAHAFLDAACRCTRASGDVAVWRRRRAGLERARADVTAAYIALDATTTPTVQRVASDVHDALQRTATRLLDPWPAAAPARPFRGHGPSRWFETRRALRAHLALGDPFTRHALRLAATFGVATALAAAFDLPHEYWLPMTVAWISKPTMGDTTVRVAARIAGTVLGVLVSAVVVEALEPGAWWLVALISLSAFVSIATLAANYAVAVSAITTFVFFLFALAGEDVESSLPSRLAATVMAGAFVLAAALLWPTRPGSGVVESLTDYAEALAAYAEPVMTDDATTADRRDAARAGVLVARTRAIADLRAAEFEVGRHRLHPETSRVVLEALHVATSQCVGCDLAGAGPDDRVAVPEVVYELDDLRVRLVAVSTGAPPPAHAHRHLVGHAVTGTVHHAHEALDRDGDRSGRRSRATGR